VRVGWRWGEVLHAPGAAVEVAVVEVEALALEDECADAVLVFLVSAVVEKRWAENLGQGRGREGGGREGGGRVLWLLTRLGGPRLAFWVLSLLGGHEVRWLCA